MVEALEKHTAEMKKTREQANAAAPCIQFLLGKVADKLTTPEELQKLAGGPVNDSNVCGVAQQLGFNRRAEIPAQVKPIALNR
jgi:hypothetical protein